MNDELLHIVKKHISAVKVRGDTQQKTIPDAKRNIDLTFHSIDIVARIAKFSVIKILFIESRLWLTELAISTLFAIERL